MTSSGRRFWLQAAILTGAAGASLWSQMGRAEAQAYSAGSNQVIVNYDVLDALPAGNAPAGANGFANYSTAPGYPAAQQPVYNGAYPTSSPRASFTPGNLPTPQQPAPVVAPGFEPFSDATDSAEQAPRLKAPSTKQKPVSSNKKSTKSTLELGAKTSGNSTSANLTSAAMSDPAKTDSTQASATVAMTDDGAGSTVGTTQPTATAANDQTAAASQITTSSNSTTTGSTTPSSTTSNGSDGTADLTKTDPAKPADPTATQVAATASPTVTSPAPAQSDQTVSQTDGSTTPTSTAPASTDTPSAATAPEAQATTDTPVPPPEPTPMPNTVPTVGQMLQGSGITVPAVTGQPEPAGSTATTTAQPPATNPAPSGTTSTEPAPSGTAGNYVVPAAPRPAAPSGTTSTAATGEQQPAPAAAGSETQASQTPANQTPAAPAAPVTPPAPPPTAELSIAFDPASPDLPDSAKAQLDQLAAKLAADNALRIVVNSYATASTEPNDDERDSKARRMSLIRAINLRQYLFSKGVKATRLDIKALGAKGANIDRIDIVQATPIQ